MVSAIRVLQKRDRLSYAILRQVSGEYSGDHLDGQLHVNIGVRAPFFRRNLTNNRLATTTSIPSAQIGSPRTFIGSVSFSF